MKQRTEPLSPEFRTTLRRRAIGIGVVALVMLGLITFIIWGAAGGLLPFAGQALFYAFFVGILLFIVGTHIRNALDSEALVLTGVITDKRTQTSSDMNRKGGSTTSWYISLDGIERGADSATFHAVAKGQTVDLWTSPSTGSIHRVDVLEGALPPVAAVVREPPEEGNLFEEHRPLVRGRLWRAIVWRGVGGAVVASTVYAVLFVVTLLGLGLAGIHVQSPVVLLVPFTVALGVWLALNRHTLRIIRDLSDGRTLRYREVVRDVIRSNTSMWGPYVHMTGPGLAGPHTYVQTDWRFVAVNPAQAEGVATGSVVYVVTTARSALVLDVRLAR